jgi:hypothetical protein
LGIAVARLIFASLITFGLLVGMVIGCVLAAMVSMGEVDLTVAIALTVVINLLIWLISPWLSDLTLRWFNKVEFLNDATVKQRYAGVHQLIHQVADEYRFTAPRIGFIPTGTRPPSPMGCCDQTPASWSRKASSSS